VELSSLLLDEWRHRRQVGGPARSYWQGELTGGMILVLRHPATKAAAEGVLRALDISEPNLKHWVMPTDRTVHEAIAWNDVLAAGLARLLLYSDPKPLPGVSHVEAGWEYYLRTWNPGAPHHETWADRHASAKAAIAATPALGHAPGRPPAFA
jgi:hypothetical protein